MSSVITYASGPITENLQIAKVNKDVTTFVYVELTATVMRYGGVRDVNVKLKLNFFFLSF